MKPRVAVFQFPGNNSEYETRRALWDAGMEADFFKWNDDPSKLNDWDGFVVAGGFSYEDRGRSGLVAAMDPIMKEIRKQADSGKPVLGICNGAQILVESGLVPGLKNHELGMSLARNKRVKGGKLLGVGFYNTNVFIRNDARQGRTAFTLEIPEGEISQVPIAHGEGRFTSEIVSILDRLKANQQIVFRYCSSTGETGSEFPLNPNGAMDSAAAICNPQGNVMAIMPHPERAPSVPMPKIFTSMRKYMEARAEGKNPLQGTQDALDLQNIEPELEWHEHRPKTVEFFVELIITDNEAQTLENALRHNGFAVKLRKWAYFEIETQEGENQADLAQEWIGSGEILNLHKEKVLTVKDGGVFPKKTGLHYYLAGDKEDAAGMSKSVRLGRPVRRGWFWEVTPEGEFDEKAFLQTHIFANHHAQWLKKA